MVLLSLLVGTVLAQTSAPKGGVTLGTLRRMVPADLRPRPGDAAAWSLLQKASAAPQVADTAQGLLEAWEKSSWDRSKEKYLVSRTEKTLEAYRPAFEALDQALEFPRWAHPRQPDSHVVNPSDMVQAEDTRVRSGLLWLPRALALRARLDIAKGQSDLAEKDLLKMRFLGEHICDMEWDDFAFFLGSAICTRVDRNVHLLAQGKLLPDDVVARLIRHSLAFPMHVKAAGCWRGELDSLGLGIFGAFDDPKLLTNKTLKREWEALVALVKDHPRPLNRSQTMKWLVDLYATQIANLKRPYQQRADIKMRIATITAGLPPILDNDFIEESQPKQLTRTQQNTMRLQLRRIDNPLGRYMIHLIAPNPDYLRAAFAAETRQDLELLATSAVVYQHRTGAWPKNLSELSATDGIEKPLRDPLTEAPFHYDRATLTVWSSGPDEDGKPDRRLRMPIEIKTPPAHSRLTD